MHIQYIGPFLLCSFAEKIILFRFFFYSFNGRVEEFPREGGGLVTFLLPRCTELIRVLDLASNCANDVKIL